MLAIFSSELETELHCDASSNGFGAILLQKQLDGKYHPVSYFSQRTTPIEAKYHSFELECLTVVYSIKRFHIHLSGIKFRIIIDCDSFRLTLSKKTVNPRISRWAMFLQEYDYEIQHRSGNRMSHVDTLSRCYRIHIIEANTFEHTLSICQDHDDNIGKLREELEKSENKLFEMRDLFYVPESMENNVIHTCHDELGHIGLDRVIENIQRVYWCPNIRQKVKNYIEDCLKCIEFTPSSGRCEGLLHSVPKGNIPFDTVHIDHLNEFQLCTE